MPGQSICIGLRPVQPVDLHSKAIYQAEFVKFTFLKIAFND